jgi:hypothetical protein
MVCVRPRFLASGDDNVVAGGQALSGRVDRERPGEVGNAAVRESEFCAGVVSVSEYSRACRYHVDAGQPRRDCEDKIIPFHIRAPDRSSPCSARAREALRTPARRPPRAFEPGLRSASRAASPRPEPAGRTVLSAVRAAIFIGPPHKLLSHQVFVRGRIDWRLSHTCRAGRRFQSCRLRISLSFGVTQCLVRKKSCFSAL